MSDGVIITIDMVIKPDVAEQVCAGIPAMFKDTVKFAGFRSIRVVRHQDQPNRLKIIEHWDSEDDYKAYSAWRNRDGETDQAMTHLISFQYDVWPAHVGYAAV